MALIVQKFGGTSVGSVERIANVAARVARFRERGDDVVVVVSAMSGETNRLLALGRDVAGQGEPAPREMDALVATGEQVASALLAIALGVRGVPARSLLGHQIRLRTDAAHTKARIRTIERAIAGTTRPLPIAGLAGFSRGDR